MNPDLQNCQPTPDYDPVAFRLGLFQSKVRLQEFEHLLLKKLRGKNSQQRMSEKLQYNFNIYGKWENGLKRLLWNDFVQILNLQKVSVFEVLEDLYKINGVDQKVEASHLILHFIDCYFQSDLNLIAQYLEVAPTRVQRWSKNQSQVPHQVVLKLLLYRPQLFLLFLEQLGLVDILPEFSKELERMKTLMQGHDRAPYNIAVLYFLDSLDYKNLKEHSTELICQKLQLSPRQVEKALLVLEKQNALFFDGKKYLLKTRSFEYPASDYKQTIPMFHYWIYRSLCYLQNRLLSNPQTEITNASSFRVFSVSKKTAERISEKIRQTHHEILQLIKESDQEDMVVRAVVMNHFGLEESPLYDAHSDPDLGFVFSDPKLSN